MGVMSMVERSPRILTREIDAVAETINSLCRRQTKISKNEIDELTKIIQNCNKLVSIKSIEDIHAELGNDENDQSLQRAINAVLAFKQSKKNMNETIVALMGTLIKEFDAFETNMNRFNQSLKDSSKKISRTEKSKKK